jgi:hypothetical protein
MDKTGIITSLTSCNTLHQSIIAGVLMSVAPALSLIYMGALLGGQTESLSPCALGLIILSTIIMAASGFLILLNIQKNMIKLRQSLAEPAAEILPDRTDLIDTHCSDDLLFVEQSLNIILQEMQHRCEFADQKQRVEHHQLQETINQHRAMIQSLEAACHRIGKPAKLIELRLSLLKQIVTAEDERIQIDECKKDIHLILGALDKLRTVKEFSAVPPVCALESTTR